MKRSERVEEIERIKMREYLMLGEEQYKGLGELLTDLQERGIKIEFQIK